MKRKTVNRAPWSGLPYGGWLTARPPAATPPTFTAQPASITLYQEGGKLEITGATLSNATAMVWQQKQPGGSWADSANTSPTLTIANADANQAGVWRLLAVNGNSAPAFSSEVYVYDCFLFMQNDGNGNNATTDGVLPGPDKYHWIDDGPAGVRYYSAFLRFQQDQALPDGTVVTADTQITNANMAKIGFTTGRMLASWATSNAAVAPASNVSTAGQLTSQLAKGTATITATFRNLKSEIAITVP